MFDQSTSYLREGGCLLVCLFNILVSINLSSPSKLSNLIWAEEGRFFICIGMGTTILRGCHAKNNMKAWMIRAGKKIEAQAKEGTCLSS